MESKFPDIAANLKRIRQIIREFEQKYQRSKSVRLIGVSKKKSVQLIETAVSAGLMDVAENYVQEALEKQQILADLSPEWHFIGPIQSNKTARIAEHFSWVHSVDNSRIAERLNRQRPDSLPRLNVLIQVNISAEDTKSGVEPGQVEDLARLVASLPKLHFRGLMAVPARVSTLQAQREPFNALRKMLEQLQLQFGGDGLDQLSMGMSHDLEAAIAEGATLVRIGTALFGERT